MTNRETQDEMYRRIGKFVYNLYQKQAVSVVQHAIKRRDIDPAGWKQCVDCGGTSMDYEHRDYDFPARVVPVCRKCNIRRGAGHLSNRRIAKDLQPYAEVSHVAWAVLRGWKPEKVATSIVPFKDSNLG